MEFITVAEHISRGDTPEASCLKKNIINRSSEVVTAFEMRIAWPAKTPVMKYLKREDCETTPISSPKEKEDKTVPYQTAGWKVREKIHRPPWTTAS